MKTNLLTAALSVLTFFGAVSCANTSDKGTSDEPHKLGIVAHRGYWNCEEAGYARNSVAALRCAQEYGFWGTEFDLHLTSDEVIIIVHDDVVNGKRIDANPYSEFADIRLENGERIPTIDDYFTQAAKSPKTMLVCEFKAHATPELEDRLMELAFAKMKEYGIYDPKRIMFVTFSKHVSDYIASEMPEFDVEYLANDRNPEELAELNITGVNYEYHAFEENPTWLDMAKSLGMRLKTWPTNNEERLKEVLDWGIDIITSDVPVEIRNMLREMGVEEL